jgi:hypothetical protein
MPLQLPARRRASRGRKVPRLTVLDPAFFDTQPAPMDSAQLHRDSIAEAGQAPRIPRNRPIVGTSQQGRVIHRDGDAQRHTEPLVSRLEAIEDAGHSLIWLLCLAVLLVMVPALIFGVSWADLVRLLAAIGGAL